MLISPCDAWPPPFYHPSPIRPLLTSRFNLPSWLDPPHSHGLMFCPPSWPTSCPPSDRLLMERIRRNRSHQHFDELSSFTEDLADISAAVKAAGGGGVGGAGSGWGGGGSAMVGGAGGAWGGTTPAGGGSEYGGGLYQVRARWGRFW